MKIGIVGAGWLGGTVGKAWLKAGHQVLFSSRHPDKQQRVAAALGPLASGGTAEEAAAFGDVVLISVPYRVLEALGQELQASLAGKIVLDACNPYAPMHRSLTEIMLLGGAPRTVAIANGTLAAAIGLGLRLWLPGLLIWVIGHMAAVWAAKRDAQFVDVVRRHLRYPAHLSA